LNVEKNYIGKLRFIDRFTVVFQKSWIKALGFLGDRLGNKSIELEVEANGKKLKVKVKASSREDLEQIGIFTQFS
jgi:hypothetical protein